MLLVINSSIYGLIINYLKGYALCRRPLLDVFATKAANVVSYKAGVLVCIFILVLCFFIILLCPMAWILACLIAMIG